MRMLTIGGRTAPVITKYVMNKHAQEETPRKKSVHTTRPSLSDFIPMSEEQRKKLEEIITQRADEVSKRVESRNTCLNYLITKKVVYPGQIYKLKENWEILLHTSQANNSNDSFKVRFAKSIEPGKFTVDEEAWSIHPHVLYELIKGLKPVENNFDTIFYNVANELLVIAEVEKK